MLEEFYGRNVRLLKKEESDFREIMRLEFDDGSPGNVNRKWFEQNG